MKLYLKDVAGNVKLNIFAAVFGIAANMALIALTNIMGLKFTFLENHILYWNSGSNPFIILTAIALLNIARHGSFKNSFINGVSKLSFLIYIIHENILLRSYYRPYMWQYIYEHFGYEHVIFWVFASAAAIFAAAAVVSFLYEQTLQRLVKIAGEKLYTALKIVYGKYERIVFKLH